MAAIGVNYQGAGLINDTTHVEAEFIIGNSGGTLTTGSKSVANFNGTTTFAGPLTVAGVNAQAALSEVTPGNVALKGWSFPAYLASASAGATVVPGTMYLAPVNLTAGVAISNIYFSVNTGAAAIKTGSNFAGIYSSAGSLVATTADLAAVIGTNTGYITAALTGTYTPTVSGQYWVGAFFNAATTEPILRGLQNGAATTTATFAAGPTATAAQYPWAINTTSNATVMPASITPGSNTLTGAFVWWCGVA
jgi:hypothetical protein